MLTKRTRRQEVDLSQGLMLAIVFVQRVLEVQYGLPVQFERVAIKAARSIKHGPGEYDKETREVHVKARFEVQDPSCVHLPAISYHEMRDDRGVNIRVQMERKTHGWAVCYQTPMILVIGGEHQLLSFTVQTNCNHPHPQHIEVLSDDGYLRIGFSHADSKTVEMQRN